MRLDWIIEGVAGVAGAVEGDSPGGSRCPPGKLLVAGGSHGREFSIGAEVWLIRCIMVTVGAGKDKV